MNILIAEDDIDARLLLRKTLEGAGHKVVVAINGEEALEKAKQAPPDLIISDILMPVMDGYKFCYAVKHDETLKKIPFVFYTATYTDQEDEKLAISLGASRYLLKPMVTDEFLRLITEVVRQALANRLPVPEEPMDKTANLLNMYDSSVTKKLQKKMQELAQAKAEIEESERCFHNLFNSMRDVIIMADNDRRIVNVNQPAMRQLFGYELDEIMGRQTSFLYATDEGFTDAGRIFFDKSGLVDGQLLETTFKRKNGEIFTGELMALKLGDNDGQVSGNAGIIRDITERKQAELELRNARDEWARTFDAIEDIVTIQNLDFRLVRCNKNTYEAFEVKEADVLGKHCYELFRGMSEPCEGCPVPLATHDFTGYSTEIFHPRLQKTFVVTASPILDERNVLQGVVHFAKDVTEQRHLEELLRQAQKMEAIGTLAGGIAHDFNNILTAILGYAELAQMALPEDSTSHADLKHVLAAGNRAKDLVRQILSFSRQSSHEKKPIRIQNVVQEVLKLLRASIPSSIEIKQNINPDCAEVMADPTQIHQIVMNLCTNANHAMRGGNGVLGVTLEPVLLDPEDVMTISPDIYPGHYLQLAVSDTGSGMDKGTMEKIFEPYFTTKKKGEGTGLGLSVVYGIVHGYGGHISVYSDLGKGTIFKVYLPVLETAALSADEAMLVTEPLPRGAERILAVDDEEAIVKFEKSVLGSLGYQVTAFTSSREALQSFREHHDQYDLVITDMTMPEISGMELSRQFMAIRPDIPIIICTGFSETVNEKKAKALGIKAYVMKPMLIREMAKLVRKVLDEGSSKLKAQS
jgi:PAS domain S-box-containing protein